MGNALRSRGLVLPLVALLVLSLGVVIGLTNAKTAAWGVYVGGKRVGVVKDVGAAREALRSLTGAVEKETGTPVRLCEDVTYRKALVARTAVMSGQQLQRCLAASDLLRVQGASIRVDGRKVASLASEEAARAVLEQMRRKGLETEDKATVLSVSFEEKVEVRSEAVPLGEIMSPARALSLLSTGTDKPLTYEVKQGDSLWKIARAHDMHVADIKADNGLESDSLQPGQQLKLVVTEPYVNVVAVVQATRQEPIPYQTKVIASTSSAIQVKQEGREGLREVTYREVRRNGRVVEKTTLAERVLREAVDKVVVRGRRLVVASSRGSSGGSLAWPLYGHINSYFGSRGGSHSGIDIEGRTGDAIRAAASGTVIYAGYDGAYGLTVAILHPNGVVTRYAHCSKSLVQEGDRVQEGDVIARVGSTGRSTGSHLHFEVIDGGGARNPLQYLR